MPTNPKRKGVKRKAPGAVQMIADGSNTVLLVFPKGSKLTGKKTLSAAQVAKVLDTQRGADVEGQCAWQCNIWCDPFNVQR
jgi:hypothetical protein